MPRLFLINIFVYFIPNHRIRKIVDHGVSTAISFKYSSYVENSWVVSILPSMIIVASVLWPLPGQYIAKGPLIICRLGVGG